MYMVQVTVFHLCVDSSQGLLFSSESLDVPLEFVYELQSCVDSAQLCDLEQVAAGLCALVPSLVSGHRALDLSICKEARALSEL